MSWERVDDYHAVNGKWTLTSNGSKAAGNQKFALFESGEFRGVRNTPKEAMNLHEQLTKGNKHG